MHGMDVMTSGKDSMVVSFCANHNRLAADRNEATQPAVSPVWIIDQRTARALCIAGYIPIERYAELCQVRQWECDLSEDQISNPVLTSDR